MSSFRIPPMIKTIFNYFPLRTIPDDPLPSGCPRPNPDAPSLYVFSTPKDAANGNPSFNPSCLKWQTYLKFCGIDYRIVPSNNHASPSGMLPFLITAGTITSSTIPSSGLKKWARENGNAPKEIDGEEPQYQAFLSLINSQLRDAWLYALYIEPTNFMTLTSTHYRSTSVPIVNFLLSHQMQTAATKELLKARPGGIINPDDIYADAESAASALSTILGGDKWFFGSSEPGFFDAVLFGYTHLILTLEWDDREAGLVRAVKKYANLVSHEGRIRERWYPNATPP